MTMPKDIMDKLVEIAEKAATKALPLCIARFKSEMQLTDEYFFPKLQEDMLSRLIDEASLLAGELADAEIRYGTEYCASLLCRILKRSTFFIFMDEDNFPSSDFLTSGQDRSSSSLSSSSDAESRALTEERPPRKKRKLNDSSSPDFSGLPGEEKSLKRQKPYDHSSFDFPGLSGTKASSSSTDSRRIEARLPRANTSRTKKIFGPMFLDKAGEPRVLPPLEPAKLFTPKYARR